MNQFLATSYIITVAAWDETQHPTSCSKTLLKTSDYIDFHYHCTFLEDGVDEVSTQGGTSTENGSITELSAKLPESRLFVGLPSDLYLLLGLLLLLLLRRIVVGGRRRILRIPTVRRLLLQLLRLVLWRVVLGWLLVLLVVGATAIGVSGLFWFIGGLLISRRRGSSVPHVILELLLRDHLDVIGRENTDLGRSIALLVALPPVLRQMLDNGDFVVFRKGQVASLQRRIVVVGSAETNGTQRWGGSQRRTRRRARGSGNFGVSKRRRD